MSTPSVTADWAYNRRVKRYLANPDIWGWCILPAVALLLRLGYAATLPPRIVVTFEADPLTYDQIARNVLAGRGFSGASFYYPPGSDTPTAFWDALYPLFLAAIYWLGGPNVPLVRVAQALLGGLAVALTFFLGKRLAGNKTGLLAAGISAVYPFFIYYSGQLLTEALFIVLILGVFCAALQAEKTGQRRWLAGQGALTGLAALCRAEALFFGLALLCWTGWRAASAGRSIALGRVTANWTVGILCFATVMAPWVARNYITFGAPILTTTKLGYNLYKYYHPDMTADQLVRAVPFPAFGDRSEPEREALLRSYALRFMADDPGRTLWFMVNKLTLLFKLTPSNEVNRQYALVSLASYGLLLPFMAAGLVLAASRGTRFLPVIVYVLFSVATKTAVFAGIRLRMQIEPFLIILAALALVSLAERLLPLVAQRTSRLPNTPSSFRPRLHESS